ncbi:MAG TPA: SAV_915 family protein [Trebonia sp.]|nr:SAV_915 family protein [Trebonia sp.]
MDHALFLVPVRSGPGASYTLRTGRLVTGERTGLAFTSEATLLLALGPSQQWVRLSGHALRNMLVPLGITHVRVDPHPVSDLSHAVGDLGAGALRATAPRESVQPAAPREDTRPLTPA